MACFQILTGFTAFNANLNLDDNASFKALYGSGNQNYERHYYAEWHGSYCSQRRQFSYLRMSSVARVDLCGMPPTIK